MGDLMAIGCVFLLSCFATLCVMAVIGIVTTIRWFKEGYRQKQEAYEEARNALYREMYRAAECNLADAAKILRVAGIFVDVDENDIRVVAHLPKYFWVTSNGVLTAKTLVTAYKAFLYLNPNRTKSWLNSCVDGLRMLLMEQMKKDPINTLPAIIGLVNPGCENLEVYIRNILGK